MDALKEPRRPVSAEEAIYAIVQATAPTTGEVFFKTLVRTLTETLGVRATLLTELAGPEHRRVRSLAMWHDGRFIQPPERDLAGTVTEGIIESAVGFWPVEMQAAFPAMKELAVMSVQSCIGVRMSDAAGQPLGALMVLSDRSIQLSRLALATLQLFATRAAAEVERRRAESALRENEALFRTIADTVPGILYTCNAAGEASYVSRLGLELMGAQAPDILGLGWQSILHADDRDRVAADWREAVAAGEPFDNEQRLRMADGTYRWFASRSRPQRDEAGAIVRWFGVCTDIDALKRAREAEREVQARLQLVLSQVPVAIWTTDRELRYTFGMGTKLAEFAPNQPPITGLAIGDVTGVGPHTTAMLDAHRNALEGRADSYESVWRGRSFHGHVEPLRDLDGTITGVAGVALDITERKRAETALHRLNQELEERVRRATAELVEANDALRREVAEHRETEAALRRSEARAQEAAQRAMEAAESNRLLVRELDHRVRNNLASLINLVDAMRGDGGSVDDFASNMHSRLLAMAKAHQTIAEAGGRSTDLKTLCGSLLDAVCGAATNPIEIRLAGPPVAVAPRQVTPLAMILQEWCTNSGKYGAHRAPGGVLHVEWDQAQDEKGRRIVRLAWRERGGPQPERPIRPSLGTELVKAFAQIELGGRLKLSYPETGAEHELEFPAD